MTENSINIRDLKDLALQKIARKHDVKVSNGVLEGEELLAFNNELKQQKIITNVKNLSDLKNPQKILSDKNIITVVENYSKDNSDTTLFGALMKDDTISRKDRKKALLDSFNIFYNAIYSTAKTNQQKAELDKLKVKFELSVEEELENSWYEWGIDEDDINEITQTMLKMHTASSEELSGEIFDYIDDTMFSFGDEEFNYLLDSIDEGNVISVSQKIKEHPNNKDKVSLLRLMAQEYTDLFDDNEATDKMNYIKTYVNQFFKAANYADTPYMDEVKKLVSSIINSFDTTSNVMTGDIEKLESLMDSVLLNKPEDIAKKLYSLIDDNSYAIDRADVRVLLDKINPSNVNEILKTFETLGDKKSLLQMIDEEWVGDVKPKDYIDKIVLARLDASGKSKDAKIKESIVASLKNEDLAETETLLKVLLDGEKSPKFLAETLFAQLNDDNDNVDKELVKHILNSINKDNVVDILKNFNALSEDVPLTRFLQDNGEKASLEYVKSITNALVEANEKKFADESFSSTFDLRKEDLLAYIDKNLENKTNITRFVNSFFPTNAEQIAQTIEQIADDKTGAADDVTFKLWIANINPDNVAYVVNEYKKMHDNKTPINAIIEERDSDESTRQALVLHILSAITEKAKKENLKLDENLVADFTNRLDKEIFGFWLASASGLNDLVSKMFEITALDKATEEATFDPRNLKLTDIRVDVPELSFGKKTGKYSWQYENLDKISTLEDVAKFTGLRVEYLKEMIESEGKREDAYKCPSGKWTIGIGHNFHSAGKEEKQYLLDNTLSDAEIYRMFAYDLTEAIHGLVKTKGVETKYLTPGEYEALVDVSFNAPGHMKDLTKGTKEGIELRKHDDLQAAASKFEATSIEFNQQYSNQKIAAGLCKRRMQNVLRYMDADRFSELATNPNARKRVVVLLKNGWQATPWYKESNYKRDVCEILKISSEKFEELLKMKL